MNSDAETHGPIVCFTLFWYWQISNCIQEQHGWTVVNNEPHLPRLLFYFCRFGLDRCPAALKTSMGELWYKLHVPRLLSYFLFGIGRSPTAFNSSMGEQWWIMSYTYRDDYLWYPWYWHISNCNQPQRGKRLSQDSTSDSDSQENDKKRESSARVYVCIYIYIYIYMYMCILSISLSIYIYVYIYPRK